MDAETKKAIDEYREDLRVLMCKQERTEERVSFADGFGSALSYAIGKIDALLESLDGQETPNNSDLLAKALSVIANNPTMLPGDIQKVAINALAQTGRWLKREGE